MTAAEENAPPLAPLSRKQIIGFIRDGFVRIDRAFPRDIADAGRAILWKDIPGDPNDPETWTQPVIRLGDYHDEPFMKALHNPTLHAAFDQLIGKGRWHPADHLGRFPIRFPHKGMPYDHGWHIDVSFPGPGGDLKERINYEDWRANISSRRRALLMLFLFSDVGETDAPTIIKVGSHHDVARVLAPAGEAGMNNAMLSEFITKLDCPQALATGEAGTVYLCHPFLVHTAQAHRGKVPRFMAQPSLPLDEPFRIHRDDGNYSPAEIAVREALETASA